MYDYYGKEGDWGDINSEANMMSPQEYSEYQLQERTKQRAKKNAEAKRIRQFAEIDPFIDILRKERDKIKGACPLRSKYNAFIRHAEIKMVDYSDCLYDKMDFDFNYSEYGWAYDKDHIGETDVCFDYWDLEKMSNEKFEDSDDFRSYIESGNILFVNHDALYDNKGECYDRYGNKHNNNYFRTISIEKYRDLDSRLLIFYADYFIEHFGFLNWYKNLSKEQIGFLRSRIDKINLSEIQKNLVLGRYYSTRTTDDLKTVIRAENSPDLSQFDDFDLIDGTPCFGNPLRGKLIQPVYHTYLDTLDYTELDARTFNQFMETYAEYLGETKTKQCELIKAIYFAAEDKNFKNGKVAYPYNASTVYTEATDDEFFGTFIRIRENMLETAGKSDKSQRIGFVSAVYRNLPVLEQFFRFYKWFKNNRIDQMKYSNSPNKRGHCWTLEDAYDKVEDLNNPQLIRDGLNSGYGRVC